MLVLSRKKNEAVTVQVEEIEIEVTVLEIRGHKVRLGFQAPLNARIHRNELLAAISGDQKPSRHTTTATKDGCH